jgi:enoyl-CoA hydratase
MDEKTKFPDDERSEKADRRFSFICITEHDQTKVITIDNPPVNALHPDVADEIRICVNEIERDAGVRSIILTGKGKCFVGGGDIRYFVGLTAKGAEDMALIVQKMQRGLQTCRVPVIAAVNGHALGGGCELMMACDIAIADERAQIGVTEVRLGLIPGAGGTRMLTSYLPLGTAKRLLFTGDRLNAEEARALGLVDQVAPAGAALSEALSLASRINSVGPAAVEAAKRSINFGLQKSYDDGHQREAALFGRLFETEDHREGIAAFLERRSARFRGH